jgi:hypothetical protein
LCRYAKELDYLDGAVSNPERPFCAIVGGSKVSSKIGVIETLLNNCDKIILGGGMIFTFYKALGKSVGSSLVEVGRCTSCESSSVVTHSLDGARVAETRVDTHQKIGEGGRFRPARVATRETNTVAKTSRGKLLASSTLGTYQVKNPGFKVCFFKWFNLCRYVLDDKIELAKELMAKAEKMGVKILLPTDVVVADKFAEDAATQIVSVDEIPDGWMGLDIGPDSLKSFQVGALNPVRPIA